MLGVFKEIHRRAVPPVAGLKAANRTQQIEDLRLRRDAKPQAVLKYDQAK